MQKYVLIILSIFSALNCFPQKEINFRHLTTNNGLSTNNVVCALEASNGFIWFGTTNGLNRYDGYTFKIFGHHDDDSTSLSDNRIRCMAEDADGKIWIGTNNGLNKFDPVTETCQHFYSNPANQATLTDNRISAIHISQNNIIWIGTENGMNKFDPATLKNTRISSNIVTRSVQPNPNKQITSIAEDLTGTIWFGMWWGGLKKIDPTTLDIKDYFLETGSNSGMNNNVLNVFVDQDNFLWIIYYMGGILKMDLRSLQVLPLPKIENTISLGAMSSDLNGNLWISAGSGLMAIYDPKSKIYNYKHNIPNDPTSISTGTVSSIFCDRSGIIWITTDKGISYYDPNGLKFAAYYRQLKLSKRDYCRSFYQDEYNQLWIDVFDVGLVRHNLLTGENRILTNKSGDPNSINHKIINGIFGDNTGNVWVATNNGISIVDAKTCKVVARKFYLNDHSPALLNTIGARTTCSQSQYFWIATGDSLRIINVRNQLEWRFSTKENSSLYKAKINCLIGDRQGKIWIGTESFGLSCFQPSTGQITSYLNLAADTASISSNSINDIFEDHQGYLWIATQNGLNRFDQKLNQFKRYGMEHGLSSNDCYSVKEDSKGRLWILNPNGLDCFDPESHITLKYDESESMSMNASGIYQTEEGVLIGGNTEKGFYMFDPDLISGTKNTQPVIFTDFILFNESVEVSKINKETPLKKSVSYTDRIVLNHSQSSFGFEFSMLNNTAPDKNSYQYKMEGFDKRWFQTDGKQRRVSYTNLNPGTYLFRVKDANNEFVSDLMEASVTIEILPPWWKTWWAYLVYFIGIAALLSFVRKYLIDKERLQHEIEIQKIETSRASELSQLKQHFFTNISHEFRTPLTLISGPIEKLIKNIDQIDRDVFLNQFHLIQRNASRLSQLTNQLLDIRKLETGNMKLEICQGNLISFIQNIAKGFSSIAEKKQIDFKTVMDASSQTNGKHWFDPDKVDKIITNLLSNAFKFTPNNGQIILRIKESTDDNLNSGFIIIYIEDSGIGIPENDLAHIFDRFFRIETSNKRSVEGTGIGLSHTKELVALLNGSILAESKDGLGSTFTVKFPTEKSQLLNYTIIDDSNTILNASNIPGSLNSRSNSTEIRKNKQSGEVLPLVLLVEDNPDMRFYIADILNNHYRVMEAENGSQGLNMAFETIPDMVISDVMMPEIDGFELTRFLKNDQRTSHIPVILLTALSSTEDMMRGLENEADEYLTKPFSEQMLLLKVKNRLQSIQRLKKQLIQFLDKSPDIKETIIQPLQPVIPSSETIFLEKLMTIIENQMSNPDFDVQRFSAEVNMEASVFHRKLKAVINQSPGDFIRSMRMKRAAQLLAAKNLSIYEIASMVGFENNTNYFSTAFRKYYGKTPTDYQNEF